MTTHDIAQLPTPAQDYIRALEAQVSVLNERIQLLEEQLSGNYAERYAVSSKPKGKGGRGSLTDRPDTVDDRDLSGIAQASDAARRPVERIPRELFGTANTPEALAYPGLTDEERSVFLSALAFFITSMSFSVPCFAEVRAML